jgi:hypothetical protein
MISEIKRYFIGIACVSLLLPSSEHCYGGQKSRSRSSRERLKWISFVRLLATPEKFDGSHISVVGFCIIEDETSALFLTREDAISFNSPNGIVLLMPGRIFKKDEYEQINHHFVRVEARFSAASSNYPPFFAGALNHVGSIKGVKMDEGASHSLTMLKQLFELKESGAITVDEYQSLKAKILADGNGNGKP